MIYNNASELGACDWAWTVEKWVCIGLPTYYVVGIRTLKCIVTFLYVAVEL